MELSNLNNPQKNHDHLHSCVDVDSVSVDHAYKLILGQFQAKKIIELPLIELADLEISSSKASRVFVTLVGELLNDLWSLLSTNRRQVTWVGCSANRAWALAAAPALAT